MLNGNSVNNEKHLLIETDTLLALISIGDRHHDEVKKFLESVNGGLYLSPYSLTELDLLVRAREILFTETRAFYRLLNDLIDYYDIGLLPPEPAYHGEAYELRSKYRGLTYFDSLHAAVGIIEDLKLVSYDQEYEKVTTLNYSRPKEFL